MYPPFIKPFALWEPPTNVIPKMYWDTMSLEQRAHAICRQIEKIITYCDYLGENTEELHDYYLQLIEEFNEFKEHGFEDYYREQVETWINANLDYIFNNVVKQVYFGLNLEGHFVAYIPESWNDIVFDTGYVYGIDTYGRLILRWDIDNSGENVNQRPEDWS